MKHYILSVILIITYAFCWGQSNAGERSPGQTNPIDSFKQKLLTASDDSTRIILLDKLSRIYTFSSADTALFYARYGLELARKINFESGEAYVLLDLASAMTTLGNYSNSLGFAYQAIPIFLKLRDSSGLSFAHMNLGLCYREQGDYEKAKNHLYTAIELQKSIGGDAKDLQGVMSSVFEKNDQLDSALMFVNLSYFDRTNWSGLLYVLGAIHSKLGQDSLALQFYRRAIPAAIISNSQIDIIDAYNGISQVYWKEGKTDSAIFYAKLALQQKWVKTYPIGVFRASELLAKMYESQKKTDSTLKYLRLTISFKDSLFNQQKTREAEAYSFNERLHQQELNQKLEQSNLQYKSRLNNYALLAGLLVFVIVSVGLWRRNIFKQKSYSLLQKQKSETDSQKSKVEKTLEELRITQSQLIQQEKMASLGEMTAGIAHEIQNPMNFVNNFSEVNAELAKELIEHLQNKDYAEANRVAAEIENNELKIIHHGKRADSIVKNMLLHSRTSAGQKEPTDINAMADEYLRLGFHGIRSKDKTFNSTIKTSFDPSIGRINIIPQDIGRVLLNLFNNAFYAVMEKKLQLSDHYEPVIEVSTIKSDGHVEIVVKDNGIGISKKNEEKIFQPFFTTKPAGNGTGLGLSLAYDIIKAHGGEIRVESKEGERTIFTIHLPV